VVEMRSIKLPEPPSSKTGTPEIFDRGISCVVRRAVIIGNGAAGAEHQCIGLVRALGLSNSFTLHVSAFNLQLPEFVFHELRRWSRVVSCHRLCGMSFSICIALHVLLEIMNHQDDRRERTSDDVLVEELQRRISSTCIELRLWSGGNFCNEIVVMSLQGQSFS
jgi:hypothetical protein